MLYTCYTQPFMKPLMELIYPSGRFFAEGLSGAGGALLGWRHFVRTPAHRESQAELHPAGGEIGGLQTGQEIGGMQRADLI